MIVDGAMAALGLTMGLVQGVVCLLYATAFDLSASLREQMPMLLASTVIFTIAGLLFLAAFIGMLRKWPWVWPLQGAVLVSAAASGLALYGLFS